MYLKRFLTLSIIKLILDDDDVIVDTLYGLTNITSSSSTVPFSFFFFFQYIFPGFLECYCPHICCLFLYIDPTHQPTFFVSGILIYLCCFELDIEDLSIFE